MNRSLQRLARLYGIQTSYVGIGNTTKEATPEALLSVLGALGASVRNLDDAPKALQQRQREMEFGPDPVIVAWGGRVPAGARAKLGKVKLPDKLPSGYHNINGTLVISAPLRAYFPFTEPTWGTFAPVYALHSNRNAGVGDLTDFRSVINWMSKLGGKVAATLPLLANFMDEPFEPSPYSPASRIFWNELYVDPEQAVEFKNSIEAQKKLAVRLPASQLIDYRAALAHKRSVLEALSNSFFEHAGTERHRAFEAFVRQDSRLEEYARFRAVTDKCRAGWNQWPEALRSGNIGPADYDEKARRYHLYAQWIVQEQLEALAAGAKAEGATLYLDLPLGLHKDAYDTWRYPDLFVKGMSAGAPPDIVFTTGQNWDLAPMHPEKMRENRHQYTIDYIQNHLKYAGLLRIDHVMGLHRFFWVPDGMPVAEGVYVEYPADELYAILSVESHRYRAGIVGENLGNVAPIVNLSMRRHNIQQMYVAQYELAGMDDANTLRPPPEDAVASLNTHDMPPYRAFLDGLDIPDKLALGFVDKKGAQQEAGQRAKVRTAVTAFLRKKRATPPEILRESLLFLGRSPAKVVLVNLEDLWQEVQPQNIPATTSKERPNWRRRLRYSVDRIRKDRDIENILRAINEVRTKKTS